MLTNALLAGTAIAVACGAVGYFVVLRAQVFAGDALSHVAFTGVLAAALAGIDLRLGLFAATIAFALLFAGARRPPSPGRRRDRRRLLVGARARRAVPLPLQPQLERRERGHRGAHALRLDLQPHLEPGSGGGRDRRRRDGFVWRDRAAAALRDDRAADGGGAGRARRARSGRRSSCCSGSTPARRRRRWGHCSCSG